MALPTLKVSSDSAVGPLSRSRNFLTAICRKHKRKITFQKVPRCCFPHFAYDFKFVKEVSHTEDFKILQDDFLS